MRRLGPVGSLPGFLGSPGGQPGSLELGGSRSRSSRTPPPRPGEDLARAGQRVFLAGTAPVPPGAARPTCASRPRWPVPVLERPLPAGPGAAGTGFLAVLQSRCLSRHRFGIEDSVSQDTTDKKGEKMRKQLSHKARQWMITLLSPVEDRFTCAHP